MLQKIPLFIAVASWSLLFGLSAADNHAADVTALEPLSSPIMIEEELVLEETGEAVQQVVQIELVDQAELVVTILDKDTLEPLAGESCSLFAYNVDLGTFYSDNSGMIFFDLTDTIASMGSNLVISVEHNGSFQSVSLD